MRRATLDHYDVAIMWTLYWESVSHYSITIYPPHQGPTVQERLYRLSRLGLAACDSPGGHEYPFLCWSLSPDGERVVEMSQEDRWQDKDYRFSLSRLPVATLDDIKREQKKNQHVFARRKGR